MTFHWPHAFWLLIIPLALLARDILRQRGASSVAHPKIRRAEAGRSSLVVDQPAFRRSGAPRVRVFLFLGLAAATVALARPQWGRLEEPVFDQAREILIALDLSRSMLSQDVKPTRLDRSRLLVTSLLERLKGERVGLAVFSGTAFLQSPLSADYEILTEFLPQLGPDFLPEGGTNYKALLQAALAAFGSSGAADRFLIILSDGEAQTDDWHPLVAELKAKGIRVISLGVGTAEGSMIPDGAGAFMKDDRGAVVLSKLNNATLRELADQTGGVYADASSWVDLAQLVSATVDQGKRGEFRDAGRVRLAERFQWALAPALLLLAISFWREFPVRPKPRTIRLAIKTTTRAPVAAVAAIGLFCALFCPAPASAAAKAAKATDAPPEPLSAPLTKLVGRLAVRDKIDARDYAELARSTLSYGEGLSGTQQPVPEGPVNDALAAVAAGQSLDAKAADWPDLRRKLEALLQKKNPPEQKKPDQPQPDKNKSDEKKDDSDKKQEQKNQESKDEKSQSPEQKQDKNSPGEKQDQPPKDDNGGNDSSPKPDSQPDQSPKQSAFGDMKDDKDKKQPASSEPRPSDAQPPSPGEMQQVGGTPDKKTGDFPLDPNLAVPLQKLDQVRQQDSPARLFQLLQDPTHSAPSSKGHNW